MPSCWVSVGRTNSQKVSPCRKVCDVKGEGARKCSLAAVGRKGGTEAYLAEAIDGEQ